MSLPPPGRSGSCWVLWPLRPPAQGLRGESLLGPLPCAVPISAASRAARAHLQRSLAGSRGPGEARAHGHGAAFPRRARPGTPVASRCSTPARPPAPARASSRLRAGGGGLELPALRPEKAGVPGTRSLAGRSRHVAWFPDAVPPGAPAQACAAPRAAWSRGARAGARRGAESVAGVAPAGPAPPGSARGARRPRPSHPGAGPAGRLPGGLPRSGPMTSSGSHSGKGLRSPWERERRELSKGPPGGRRCQAKAGVTPGVCRPSDRWEAAGFCPLFGVTRPGRSRQAAWHCPRPAGQQAGRGFISSAGTQWLARRRRQVQAGGRRQALPSPPSWASVSPQPSTPPPWVLALPLL